MKEGNSFDDFIRGKVGNYASTISEDAWERFEEKKDREGGAAPPDNRSTYGILGLLFLVGMIGGGMYFFNANSSPSISLDHSNIVNAQSTIAPTSKSASEKGANVVRATELENKNSKAVDASIQTNTSQAVKQNEEKFANKTNGVDSESSQSKITRNETRRIAKQTVDEKAVQSSLLGANSKKEDVGDRHSSFETQDLIASIETLKESSEIAGTINKERASISNDQAVNALSLVSASERASSMSADFIATSLRVMPMKSGFLDLEERMGKTPMRDKALDCQGESGSRTRWYLDLLYSPDYAIRRLDARQAVFEADRVLREDTEYFSNAYTTGARISFMHDSGISVRSGLLFSQITEKNDFKNQLDQTELYLVPTDTLYLPGQTVYLFDTLYVGITGQRERIVWNRYKHIDIPLILGYEWGKSNIKFNVNGGVYVNIDSWQRGQYADPVLNDLLEFTTGNAQAQEVYKRNVGLSLFGSVSANYCLNEKYQIILEPQFRHFLKSHSLDSYGLDQSYTTIGFFTGIRIKL